MSAKKSLPRGALARAEKVLAALQARYPRPATHLEADNAWELLVATVLAAQCTDARVNTVTPELFRRWPGPAELALATQEELESVIRSTGFYHSKARNLLGAAQRVVSVYGGEVPPRLDELITLPGVARKTANVVLFGAFGINEGLAVDTHVKRISYRLGLTAHTDPNGATSITAWSGSAAMSATPAAPAARNARWPTSAPAANRPRENSCWGKERGGRGELWLAHKVPPFPHTPILLQTRFIQVADKLVCGQ